MLEAARIVLPLIAAACFLWGAWQCAVRTLSPAAAPTRMERALPEGLWKVALACLLVGIAVQGVFVVWCMNQGSYASLG